MIEPDSFSFTRYLSAKKSVDDRALNRYVWEQIEQALPPGSGEEHSRVLEVGAGIGTMVERALEWELLREADYTAIDSQEENIRAARARLTDWARSRGMRFHSAPHAINLADSQHNLTLVLETIDLYDFIAREKASHRWDLLIAHAFLDLVDVPATLPDLLALLAPGGLFYFSLNFDGMTLFEPTIDPEWDETIQALYHNTMDARRFHGKPSGDSRTGRHLFKHIENAGAHVLAAGASDWVVYPMRGQYPGDEAYFLHFILHTIYQALEGHPELEKDRFASWVAERHDQIERGELVYIAHQLDVLGKAGS